MQQAGRATLYFYWSERRGTCWFFFPVWIKLSSLYFHIKVGDFGTQNIEDDAMAVDEPPPSVKTLSPLAQGFAIAAANKVFKNPVQQAGDTPIAQRKDKVYPVILGLPLQVRSLQEDLQGREKSLHDLQRELSKARALIIDLADSRNLVTHRALINQLVGTGFSSDKTLRTHAAEWILPRVARTG